MIRKQHFSTPTLNKGWGGDKEGGGHGVAAFGSPGPVVIRNGVPSPCLVFSPSRPTDGAWLGTRLLIPFTTPPTPMVYNPPIYPSPPSTHIVKNRGACYDLAREAWLFASGSVSSSRNSSRGMSSPPQLIPGRSH